MKKKTTWQQRKFLHLYIRKSRGHHKSEANCVYKILACQLCLFWWQVIFYCSQTDWVLRVFCPEWGCNLNWEVDVVANIKSINGLVFYKPNGSNTLFLPQLVSLDSTFTHLPKKKRNTKKANSYMLMNIKEPLICSKYQLVIRFKYHQ